MGKKWTYQEIKYLKENYGNLPLTYIARKLKRTLNAVLIKKNKLKLGAYVDHADDYILFNQFAKMIGVDISYYNKLIKSKFPIRKIKRIKDYVKIVKLDEFLQWVEKDNNKQLINIAKTEKGDFGAIEPEWFEEKRRADKRYNEYKQTKWTEEENKQLIDLCKMYRYSWIDISKKLMRLETAIKRQLTALKSPYRPLRADNHNMWEDKEIETVKKLYLKGYNTIVIRDYLNNRSQLAINGLLERHNYFLKEKG